MAAAAVLLPPVTPPTYHRIVSPTLTIPSDPQVSIPVGLLACQRDPHLRDLVTVVVSSRLSQSHSVPSNGRKSKKDKAPPAPTEPLLEIILHDTIIFPEGGGQPSDVGLLTSADGELWDVIEVKRHGGHAVHYIRAHDLTGESALQVFTPGARVGVALGEEGLKRRIDHTCMHTSQHLLSAILETRLGLPTLSWGITAFPTPSYVEIPRGLTPSELTVIQDEVNRLVFEGHSVHVEVEELDRTQLALDPGRTTSKGVPVDYTGGVKRTVVIDGIDRSPCCGTHFPSLHNLPLFLVPHADASERASTASVRLCFLAGPRLIAHLSSTHALLSSTAVTMSCGASQVPERVEQVVEERRRFAKRIEELERELASTVAREMAGAGAVLHRHRTDDSANALGFLNAISVAYTGLAPGPHLVVLSSSPSAQSAQSTNVVLVFGSDEKEVKEVGEGLRSKLGVKGGGKGTRWSGKFVGVWKDGREGTLVDEVLNTAKGL
ncbi:hypothetical protein B0H21DRAFT_733864 [Amylocystis lapponica]|nr:hypothetical protein B0H21DRAFT_733864 [Amylocystis lapponica]